MTTAPPLAPPAALPRGPGRRRPSGSPPPLPRHIKRTGVRWLIALVVTLVLTPVVFAEGGKGLAVPVTIVDDTIVRWIAGWSIPGFTEAARMVSRLFSSWWAVTVGIWGLAVVLIVFRRWRHLVVYLACIQIGALIIDDIFHGFISRPHPFGVRQIGSWGGSAMPSLQFGAIVGVTTSVLYTMVPEGRARNRGKLIAAIFLLILGLARMRLGIEAPTDLLVSMVIGVAIPVLGFRLFLPADAFPVAYKSGSRAHLDVGGIRGQAIRQALEDQLGLPVTDVQPFGLSGSAGSTPLRIAVATEPPTFVFGKLYAKSHLRSDRWYKLGRELLYGRLEDEKPFHSVRRLVQQEDYALRVMQAAGLPTPAPYGFVELTPESEYLLVTDFFDGATELGDAEVDQGVIDEGLEVIRALWQAGLAHRDVKPANILVRDGRVLLIDVAFAEVRPTPWRQAVDLANMMLCLALRSSPEEVYERARLQFTDEEIGEAFAAARGLAMPSQLRRAMKEQGRNLHTEFIRLLPAVLPPIKVQRWNPRRLGLVLLLLGVVLFFVQGISGMLNLDLATRTPLRVTDIACATDYEPMWLEAQSVPNAALVPCVRNRSLGWQVSKITVNNGRSTIVFNHDRVGTSALVVTLTPRCDIAGTNTTVNDITGAERLTRPATRGRPSDATWFEVFHGGCITARLSTHGARPELAVGLAAEANNMIGSVTRERLQDELSDRSDGRLHLDP